ncbi:hypothetical protein ACFQ0O_24035 [Saccharopolyspora spinosporotrichia]
MFLEAHPLLLDESDERTRRARTVVGEDAIAVDHHGDLLVHVEQTVLLQVLDLHGHRTLT